MGPKQIVGHDFSERDHALDRLRGLADQTSELGRLPTVARGRVRLIRQHHALTYLTRHHHYALIEHRLKYIGDAGATFARLRHNWAQHVANRARVGDVIPFACGLVLRSREGLS